MQLNAEATMTITELEQHGIKLREAILPAIGAALKEYYEATGGRCDVRVLPRFESYTHSGEATPRFVFTQVDVEVTVNAGGRELKIGG
jgi:hypothetical protein